jgi:hypothetical protein
MLDTKTYEIEFPDDRNGEYTANTIAENMYTQCDGDPNNYNLMEIIVDHNTDGNSVDRADMCIKHGSNKQIRKTPNGWHLFIE